MENLLRKRFGARFRELRIAYGLSQEAFADHASVARSYLSRVERGAANPSLDAVERLAAALGVDVHTLFENAAPEPSCEALTVPFAADGSCFNPDLASPRDGSFRVGGRGSERRLGSFEEALEHLRSMPVAKWRRPNHAGNWGLVSAVRWDRSTK